MADDSSSDIYDLQKDLRMSMIIAAFTGISWFIGAEINTSLFLLFKRRRGLYFWSAALSSWGVVLQPLFIILADFGIWTDLKGSITMIYLTWFIMVIPQSWLLYSRLHLIANHGTMLRWIKFGLIFTSIVFSVPTIIMGTIAQATNISPGLFQINMTWDRIQLTVYFAQETALSMLYIWQARKYLRSSSLLSQPHLDSHPSASAAAADGSSTPARRSGSDETRQVLSHLVFANVLVIALDVALLGVQYAGLFYLQGAFKPCVYGVKLKVEFAILNRLVETVRMRGRRGGGGGPGSYYHEGGPGGSGNRGGGFGTVGGGRPSAVNLKSAGQSSQPQIYVSGYGGEAKRADEMPEDMEEGGRHEHIGLGTMDHHRSATGPSSRPHSTESQQRIWDGRGPGRGGDVDGGSTPGNPATTAERQSPWRQAYHR